MVLKELLVGGGGVQWVDEVGEDKRHQHEDVGDSLVYTCSWLPAKKKVNKRPIIMNEGKTNNQVSGCVL